jgi:hypothetical protein
MSEQNTAEHDPFLDKPLHRKIIEEIYLGLMVDESRSVEDVKDSLRSTSLVEGIPDYQRDIVMLLATKRAEDIAELARQIKGVWYV